MKLPSSSSFVAVALIASSSIPSLAAPATVPSKDHTAISSDNQFVTSHSENIVHSAAEKDDVHKEDAAEGKKGLLSDLINAVLCMIKMKDCGSHKDKPKHEKRFKNAAPQTSHSPASPSPIARDLDMSNGGSSNSADAGQSSRTAFDSHRTSPSSSHGQA